MCLTIPVTIGPTGGSWRVLFQTRHSFESDKSGSVVTYEIFFAFTIQQQRQLQMIRLNDHPRINENYGEKGKIIPIFFLP